MTSTRFELHVYAEGVVTTDDPVNHPIPAAEPDDTEEAS